MKPSETLRQTQRNSVVNFYIFPSLIFFQLIFAEMEIFLTIKQKTILAIVFLVFLIVGAISYDDYGIAWDEPNQLEIGKINYEYMTGRSDTVLQHHDRYYGVAFEMPAYMLQQALGIEQTASIYNFRHALTHLLFIIAIGFFFALLWKLFGNFNAALLGSLMLWLHPRIFAHSFFNSKDLVFMSIFIIGLYTLLLLIEKPSGKRIFFHALASALLIDTRILGIILPFLTFMIMLPVFFKESQSRKTFLKYSVLTIALIYLFWPALWGDPFLLGKSFARMSHFPFRYEVLFMGKLIPAVQIPWSYIPVWIGISTPPFILLLYFTGFFFLLRNYFRKPDEWFHSPKKWFILSIASFPIDFTILLIIFNSTLYDGWRQVFFFYPMLLLAAAYTYFQLLRLWQNKKTAVRILNGFIIIFILLTALKLYKLHPYEQVYFNHFVSKKDENRRKSFEMDYWGLSYREAIGYLLQTDHNPKLKICFANAAGPNNILYFPMEDQKRIVVTEKPEDADYFITNYRYHPQDYPYENEFYKIVRGENRILSVFKLKEDE